MADVHRVMIVFETSHRSAVIAASVGLSTYTTERSYPTATVFRSLMSRLQAIYADGIRQVLVATDVKPEEWRELVRETERTFGGLQLERFNPEGSSHLTW